MINKEIRDTFFKELSKKIGNQNSIKLEEGLFDFSNSYAENNGTPFLLEEIYKTKSNEILDLLSKDNLQNIIFLIKNNKIKPEKIPFMDKNDLIKNKKIIKNTTNKNKVQSDAFECPKCGKRNVSVIEKQIKRGDEPATPFITCLECGYIFML